MARVKIRAFKAQDLKAVLRIAKSLGYFSLKDLKNMRHDALKNNCLIAALDSKPVGFIVFSALKPKGKILWLAVNRKAQGFGLGSKLLKRAEGRIKARKASKVMLHTFGFSGNYLPFLKVRDFYYRHGFQRLREIPNGFMQGVDKLVMVKEFG
ncbi:MAG TPA: GNAT family N-acetyltransferase [Candidatus Diapherotrites archaeon]|uniref:GNAT family N-acetyltransferase n=1 Tax=Candidatus Iainarchaeum sp. TaxID=3101447 RepID=A0A7J4JZT0_9ARCH|nr:GNAT family N-acetyltransferase [Candidatus Diapherotrites archaeon]